MANATLSSRICTQPGRANLVQQQNLQTRSTLDEARQKGNLDGGGDARKKHSGKGLISRLLPALSFKKKRSQPEQTEESNEIPFPGTETSKKLAENQREIEKKEQREKEAANKIAANLNNEKLSPSEQSKYVDKFFNFATKHKLTLEQSIIASDLFTRFYQSEDPDKRHWCVYELAQTCGDSSSNCFDLSTEKSSHKAIKLLDRFYSGGKGISKKKTETIKVLFFEKLQQEAERAG